MNGSSQNYNGTRYNKTSTQQSSRLHKNRSSRSHSNSSIRNRSRPSFRYRSPSSSSSHRSITDSNQKFSKNIPTPTRNSSRSNSSHKSPLRKNNPGVFNKEVPGSQTSKSSTFNRFNAEETAGYNSSVEPKKEHDNSFHSRLETNQSFNQKSPIISYHKKSKLYYNSEDSELGSKDILKPSKKSIRRSGSSLRSISRSSSLLRSPYSNKLNSTTSIQSPSIERSRKELYDAYRANRLNKQNDSFDSSNFKVTLYSIVKVLDCGNLS